MTYGFGARRRLGRVDRRIWHALDMVLSKGLISLRSMLFNTNIETSPPRRAGADGVCVQPYERKEGCREGEA